MDMLRKLHFFSVQCPEAVAPANGSVTVDSNIYTYSCDSHTGYELIGESTRTCLESDGNTNCKFILVVCLVNDYFLAGTEICTEGSIRLVEGFVAEGTVQYCHNGTWGWVCGDSWTVDTAEVACRQLGLPSSGKSNYCSYSIRSIVMKNDAFYIGAGFGSYYKPLPTADPYYLKTLDCEGTEQNLGQCNISYGTWCRWRNGTGLNGLDYDVATVVCPDCK